MPKNILIGVTLANRGGAQVFVFQLAKWLKQQGHHVTVMFGPGDWLPEKLDGLDIPWIRLKHMVRNLHPWHDLLSISEMRTVIQKIKPDAVHLNSSKMGATGSIAARQAHVPNIVYCIGGWVFLEALSPLKKYLYILIERWTASCKDWIINLHPGDKDAADRLHIKPKHEIVVIPNGVDIAAIESHLLSKTEARNKLAALCQTKLDDTNIIFGTIANLFPQKDLVNYVESCAIVSKQIPQARFIILGEGQERAAIEQAVRQHGLQDKLFLPGAIENAPNYLHGFDAHVLPSSKEGMPFTVLEAMAAEVPNIATDVGAIRWMLNGNGWISSPQNPNRLAQTMINFTRDQDTHQQKTNAAYQKLINSFELEWQMKEHEKILTK